MTFIRLPPHDQTIPTTKPLPNLTTTMSPLFTSPILPDPNNPPDPNDPNPQYSTYVVDNHATKVAELLAWIKTFKQLSAFLAFCVLLNFVLMYGLMRYPCARICPSGTRGLRLSHC